MLSGLKKMVGRGGPGTGTGSETGGGGGSGWRTVWVCQPGWETPGNLLPPSWIQMKGSTALWLEVSLMVGYSHLDHKVGNICCRLFFVNILSHLSLY